IKQKTRWVFGINFEATHRLGWRADLCDFYFFVRDRKGMFTNLLPPISVVLLILMVVGAYDLDELPPALQPVLLPVLSINIAAMTLRFVFRVLAFKQVYGRYDVGGVLLRWPVAVVVNALAVWRAWRIYFFESGLASRPIVWAKTQHEVPMDFSS